MKNDIYASVATAVEHNLESRKLIKKIIDVVVDAVKLPEDSSMLRFSDFSFDIIKKITGDKHTRCDSKISYGNGIVEIMDFAKNSPLSNVKEVSINMMYPEILRQEYGHYMIGDWTILGLVDTLIATRKAAKRFAMQNDAGDDISLKIKMALCGLFSYVTSHDFEYREEIATGVPLIGRKLLVKLAELHISLGAYPVYADHDELFVIDFNDVIPLGTELWHKEYKVSACDYEFRHKFLVINNKKRYMTANKLFGIKPLSTKSESMIRAHSRHFVNKLKELV